MAGKMTREERRDMLVSLLVTGMTVCELGCKTGYSDTTIKRDLDDLCACNRVHIADRKAGRFRPTRVYVAGPPPDQAALKIHRDPLVAALFSLPFEKGETVDVRAIG